MTLSTNSLAEFLQTHQGTPPYALKKDVYKLSLIREVSDETTKAMGTTADVSTIYIPAESRRAEASVRF